MIYVLHNRSTIARLEPSPPRNPWLRGVGAAPRRRGAAILRASEVIPGLARRACKMLRTFISTLK